MLINVDPYNEKQTLLQQFFKLEMFCLKMVVMPKLVEKMNDVNIRILLYCKTYSGTLNQRNLMDHNWPQWIQIHPEIPRVTFINQIPT